MSYVIAVLVYLHLWNVGQEAIKTEATQRPDIQCSQMWIDNGGTRPLWCPKT